MPKRQYIRDAFGQFAHTQGDGHGTAHIGAKPEGKHTAATVAKRIADPTQPIEPAGPRPKTYTASTHPGGIKGFFDSIRNGPTPDVEAAWDDHDRRLRNDPAYHKLTAQVFNHERATRRREQRQGLGG